MTNISLGNSIPRSGLVGEWLLDGNATATVGTSGTPTNVTWGTDGVRGYQKGYGSFNGSTSKIDMGNVLDETGTSAFSLSIWIKYTNTANQMLFGKQLNSGNFTGYMIWHRGTPDFKLEFTTVSTPTNLIEVLFPSGYTDGNLHHIVVTYDGSKTAAGCKGYVDGVPVVLTTLADTLTGSISTTATFGIGNRNNGNLPTNGNLALAKKYNKILTQEEIQLLYLEGLRKLGPSNIASYPSLMNGLVGYWDFKGTAHNLVDGVAGTVSGATLTTDRFGYANSAYSFNGVNDNILISSAPDYFGTQSLSLSAYIYITALPTSTNITMPISWVEGTIDSGTYDKSFDINSSGQISFRVFDGASKSATFAGLTIGTYYHIIGTYDGTNVRIYVNGVAGTPTTATGTFNFTTPALAFSGNGGGSRVRFNGKIDDTQIFNRALSADEVSQLYALTSKDYIYPTKSYDLPGLRDGLVLDLNEQGKDLSGQGNDGTLVNSPTVIRQGKAKGLTYNGSNQYVEIPDAVNLRYQNGGVNGNLSISVWYIPTNTTGVKTIIGKWSNDRVLTTDWIIYTNGTSVSLGILGTAVPCTASSVLTAGKPVHIVGTFTSGKLQSIYIDGVFKASATETNSPSYTIYDPIRTAQNTGTNYNNGKVLNPKLYSRALTPTEIYQLYYKDKGNYIY